MSLGVLLSFCFFNYAESPTEYIYIYIYEQFIYIVVDTC